ncbi:MAG TPA: MFS transporter [Chitinophagaceae bacterium]|nr:MFS transporter [Chitinophagaceae bacterium]HRX93696.1 MFS transporter [Chitinophagaceae bacterium]
MTKPAIGKYRWRILALLFVATTINYMDRSIIGVLAPTLQYKVFHWSDVDYANINIAFKIAYAIGMLTMGALIDRYGTKIGYALSIAIWSIFGMLHALVKPAFSLVGFIVARFGLGFGEAGNFPSAIKTVAEWFPKKERAFATGIFNAGSNIGAILAPLIVPMIVLANGKNWQFAFLITGLFSAIWVFLWLKMYKKPEVHPKVTAEELAHINSDDIKTDAPVKKLPWSKVIPKKETWAFATGKITDAVWWFYLFWGGKYLYDQFGLNIKKLALPLIIIYLVADVGSIVGGWLSGYFMKKGWSLNKARKTTLLICALFILPVMFVTQIKTAFRIDNNFFTSITSKTYTQEKEIEENGEIKIVKEKVKISDSTLSKLELLRGNEYSSAKSFITDINKHLNESELSPIENNLMNSARANNLYWIAVFLIAFAAAGHQAWSANLFTLVSDVFPKRATASVTGIGGMVGAIAGLLADFSLGQTLKSSGASGYFFAFLIAGVLYLVILGIIHLIMPRMTPLDENLNKT